MGTLPNELPVDAHPDNREHLLSTWSKIRLITGLGLLAAILLGIGLLLSAWGHRTLAHAPGYTGVVIILSIISLAGFNQRSRVGAVGITCLMIAAAYLASLYLSSFFSSLSLLRMLVYCALLLIGVFLGSALCGYSPVSSYLAVTAAVAAALAASFFWELMFQPTSLNRDIQHWQVVSDMVGIIIGGLISVKAFRYLDLSKGERS